MVKKKMKSKSEGTEKKSVQDSIRAGVGGVIEQNGKWLLVKRSDSVSKEPGKWEFPGGPIRFGEMSRQALVGLAESNFGITTEANELVGIYEGVIDGVHWVSPQYRLIIKGGTPQIIDPEISSGIGWFSKNELSQLSLSEITVSVLEMMQIKK
jgi:ADP-ribose pyrophosphatase YjhB (NUDIX family)